VYTTVLVAQRPNSRSQVVRAQDGEQIFGTSLIKVSPQTGVPSLALALMRTAPNGRSGVHVHERADQLVLIVAGSGYVRLGDDRSQIGIGDTVYVPRGTWHEFGAGAQGMEAQEIFVPAGVEQEFREANRLTDGGKKSMSLAEMNRIAGKYGSHYKDPGQ
jgi:quercetin dioxygenase-like cupin family protein